MVLEIVSSSSVANDTRLLRQLYWRAAIPEYWLADARGDTPQFDILRHGSRGYRKIEAVDGWLRSRVFDREFRLTQATALHARGAGVLRACVVAAAGRRRYGNFHIL